KYAIIAAVLSLVGYIVAGSVMTGIDVAQQATNLLVQNSNPLGLLHLISVAIVIGTAVRGRHIVEAISWGLIASIVINLLTGLASVSDMLVFKAPQDAGIAQSFSFLPFIELVESGQ